MPAGRKWFPAGLIAGLALAVFSQTAHAYIDLTHTLAKVMADSRQILLVEAVEFNAENSLVLKEVKALKGPLTDAAAPVTHGLSWGESRKPSQQLLQWAQPGARGVLFLAASNNNLGFLCIGQSWYLVHSAGARVWRLGEMRADLPLAYYGSVSHLATSIDLMQSGKDAILTVVAYGGYDEGASFDIALNRANLPGLVKVQRIRARLKMPPEVMTVSANPAYFIGVGLADASDVPALSASLKSTVAGDRADAAETLGWLGPKAQAAVTAMTELLKDSSPAVRAAAAGALLRIAPKTPGAADVLAKCLESRDAAIRRDAAFAAGLAGPAAEPLVDRLIALLKDTNTATRFTALQAISTLGPVAAKAVEPVTALLSDEDLAIEAADALGRIGVAARPALKRLTTMLDSEVAAIRWAAVRAMSQIGGEEAKPAADFMIRALPEANEVDRYNMMIYFALLGPVAKDAAPAIQRNYIKNPALPPATLWALDPEKTFPWQSARRFGPPTGGEGPEFARLIFESYVRELGDRLSPAAKVLAQQIMDGTAGNVPVWGYKILAADTAGSLAALTPRLADADLLIRERAAVALGYMGSAAYDAWPEVELAMKNAANDREKRLLAWCLREIGKE